jgi:hypothetical protein
LRSRSVEAAAVPSSPFTLETAVAGMRRWNAFD